LSQSQRIRSGSHSLELIAAGASGDLAYTVGVERTDLSVDGGPPHSTKLRVTHVYRREYGEWKIVHRHGDYVPLDEPAAEASPSAPDVGTRFWGTRGARDRSPQAAAGEQSGLCLQG
jgi:hypothetical protein